MRRVWVEISDLLSDSYNRVKSPSLRRVWVEISTNIAGRLRELVTLLAEGVG